MIRDEFLQKQQEKKLSSKDMSAMRSMGERAFYTTKIAKYDKLIKTLNVSVVAVLFILVVATIPIILAIFTKTFGSGMIFPTVLAGVLYALVMIWCFLMKPNLKKKIQAYSNELATLREKELKKQKAIYEKMKG